MRQKPTLDKNLKIFFKRYRADLWLHFFNKANNKNRMSQRYFVQVEHQLFRGGFFQLSRVIKKKVLTSKTHFFNTPKHLNRCLMNIFLWQKWFNKKNHNKTSRKILNLSQSQVKSQSFRVLKSNSKKNFLKKKLSASSFSEFFTEKASLFSLQISPLLFKFYLEGNRTSMILAKKKVKTLSYELFFKDFDDYRYKPRKFLKKQNLTKNKWHNWLNQKILVTYFGFSSVKTFILWKKKFLKKNSTKPSIVLYLENTLVNFLFRSGVFQSFRHGYNLIIYGGILINNKNFKAPHFLLKKNDIVTFCSFFLKQKVLQLFLLKVVKGSLSRLLPSYIEFYLPLVILLKTRELKFSDLKTLKAKGLPKAFGWL